ncbi:MAG: acetyltransferase, partial [Rhizobium sp.]|nr:acetyltransferase [Rhizobium sp.]
MSALIEHREIFPVASSLAPRLQQAPEIELRGHALPRQPQIRTGRLTLRRPEPRDAEAISASLANYRVARMLTRVPQPYHLEDAEEWLVSLGGLAQEVWVFAIT